MLEKGNRGLLQFITSSQEKLRVLVVESCIYLPDLRELIPYGDLYAVTADADIPELPEYKGLNIHWSVLDFREVPLPYEKEFFDYILAERCLENAVNPQDIASGFGNYIKQTGSLLTTFLNVRHWEIIQELMEGHFYHICTHIFSKSEMMRLLFASFYKDAVFAPERRYAPDGLIAKLETCGFENYQDDLETEVWMVKAARSMPEIAVLKSFYTPLVRRKLVTLLRRIEFTIDCPQNIAALWEHCDEQQIFPAYLASFIQETVTYRGTLYRLLWQATAETERQIMMEELLQEAEKIETVEIIRKELLSLSAAASVKLVSQSNVHTYVPCVDKTSSNGKVAFITCVNNETLYEEALLYLRHLVLPPGMQAEYIGIRNAVSMAAGYNEGMHQTDARYKVYLHQDTLLVNKNFITDMLVLFSEKNIGAFGVIGCRKLPKSGVWWDGMRIYGRVLHACEAESIADTKCMEPTETYAEVEAIDGLLMATQYDLPWREDLFTGWHFYEISQCKELERKGYKTVIPQQPNFWCIHLPKEKALAPSYKKYQKIFLKEYGEELNPEI